MNPTRPPAKPRQLDRSPALLAAYENVAQLCERAKPALQAERDTADAIEAAKKASTAQMADAIAAGKAAKPAAKAVADAETAAEQSRELADAHRLAIKRATDNYKALLNGEAGEQWRQDLADDAAAAFVRARDAAEVVTAELANAAALTQAAQLRLDPQTLGFTYRGPQPHEVRTTLGTFDLGELCAWVLGALEKATTPPEPEPAPEPIPASEQARVLA